MIKFNELRISSNRYLIIDVSVKNEDYYKDVYIKSVSVDTQDTYKDNGPSEARVYYQQFDSNTKTFRLELGIESIKVPLDTNMFFVYIEATGTPAADTPCGQDNAKTLGITFNVCSLYDSIMSYVKQTANSCQIPKNFIDLFLQFKAFEISLHTNHFTQAIEIYNKFLKIPINAVSNPIKPCNCHG